MIMLFLTIKNVLLKAQLTLKDTVCRQRLLFCVNLTLMKNSLKKIIMQYWEYIRGKENHPYM